MKIYPVLWMMLLPVMGVAQEIKLAGTEFQESVTENARVSGDIVMGVMLTDDLSSPGFPSLSTGNHWIANDAEAQVCVRIVTKDGRYEAENTYIVPQHYQFQSAEFPYGGTRSDILSRRSAAAIVKTGACGSRDAIAVPVLPKTSAASDMNFLHVFINAAGNPVDVAWGRQHDQITSCADVTELDGLKYTARCDVPLKAMPLTEPTVLTFFIARGNTEEDFQLSVMPPYASR